MLSVIGVQGVVLAAGTGSQTGTRTGTVSPESAIAGKGVTDAWKLRFHNAKVRYGTVQ